MTAAFLSRGFWSGPRLFAVAAVSAILAVFIAANWHLVAVSLATHPDCVMMYPQEGAGAFAAAKPSC